jgi:hypothetical protein
MDYVDMAGVRNRVWVDLPIRVTSSMFLQVLRITSLYVPGPTSRVKQRESRNEEGEHDPVINGNVDSISRHVIIQADRPTQNIASSTN